MPTNLWLFLCRNLVHSLCRDVIINRMRRWRAEELFCFNHILQTGMKELELCLVHRPENIIHIRIRIWKNDMKYMSYSLCLQTIQTRLPLYNLVKSYRSTESTVPVQVCLQITKGIEQALDFLSGKHCGFLKWSKLMDTLPGNRENLSPRLKPQMQPATEHLPLQISDRLQLRKGQSDHHQAHSSVLIWALLSTLLSYEFITISYNDYMGDPQTRTRQMWKVPKLLND